MAVTTIIATVIWLLVLVKFSRRCFESLFGLIHPQECRNQCVLGAYGINNSNNITWEIK
jgi:hypothetical protein